MGHFAELATRTKAPTVLALVVLLTATALGWMWVWGVFFFYWAVVGIVAQQAFVVQTVRRDENPVLFWVISVSWLALSGLMILSSVFSWATG
ncbi:MAG: hypothetical protein OXG79_13415 [Chloroflexi bacterium]|nr:hypothetical protein [Chloroflexota bacterium]